VPLYPGYRVRLRQREVLAGVPVVRVPLYPEHSRSGAGRVLNYVSFALSSAVLRAWLTKRPDVIFAYHPPLTIGLPATLLSRLWRVPFVYQIQDMWPETLSATGMLNDMPPASPSSACRPGRCRRAKHCAAWRSSRKPRPVV
jgi:hypothetical protein